MPHNYKKFAFGIFLSISINTSQAQYGIEFNLSELNFSRGFVVNGVNDFDTSGRSVSNAGDLNGDGIDDLIIGAPLAELEVNSGFDNGISYVIYGRATGFSSSFNLSNINGSNGFLIKGINQGDESGRDVSNAGDFNGDGIDDLMIGASNAETNTNINAGSVYVIFGSKMPLPSPFNLSDINETNGLVINGINTADSTGRIISNAGDINGDDKDDLIIGIPYFNNKGSGRSYVIYGSDSPIANPLQLSLIDGNNGFVINGTTENDLLGTSVSNLGDFNGDGLDDLIVGAAGFSPDGLNNAGRSYVLFGSQKPIPHPFELSSINGLNGFVINGENENDYSGDFVSNAGDLNGDGIDDLIVSTFAADPNQVNNAGIVYVVFGSNKTFSPVLELSALNGINGYAIHGMMENVGFGTSISSAGDINDDGIDDLIIGASRASPNNEKYAGISYVIYGSDKPRVSPFNVSNINGNNGFIINGADYEDFAGESVSKAGDVNNDGVDDIIIGAPIANVSAGRSYVIFGQRDMIFRNGFEN